MAKAHFFFRPRFVSPATIQTAFDAVFISTFNVIYSSLPILVVGILEQDVTDKSSLEHPYLYVVGPRNLLFDYKLFYWSLLRGVWHGFVIFFVVMLGIRLGGSVRFCATDGGGGRPRVANLGRRLCSCIPLFPSRLYLRAKRTAATTAATTSSRLSARRC